jgi:tRNA (adenine37-N6)-methyltransferase
MPSRSLASLLEEQHAEVRRDRVEAAAVHDACARGARGGFVALDHAPDPLHFAGEVAIVGARGSAQAFDQRLAVHRVGPDGRHDDARPRQSARIATPRRPRRRPGRASVAAVAPSAGTQRVRASRASGPRGPAQRAGAPCRASRSSQSSRPTKLVAPNTTRSSGRAARGTSASPAMGAHVGTVPARGYNPRDGHRAAAQRARLTLEPIGYAHTGARHQGRRAARQPQAARRALPGRIELLPGRHFDHALDDLAGWDYVWVVFWFHLNPSWRPKVLPPRSTSGRKGVFSTRSPHRPNPIGLSALRLERIEGLTLHLLDVDLVDGTPVLDIKPYVPYTDAHPAGAQRLARRGASAGAAGGRRRDGTRRPDPVTALRHRFDGARRRAGRLDRGTQRTASSGRASAARCELGPEPHPYRRIRPRRHRLSPRDQGLADALQPSTAAAVQVLWPSPPATALAARARRPSSPPPTTRDNLHREFVRRWGRRRAQRPTAPEGTLPFWVCVWVWS